MKWKKKIWCGTCILWNLHNGEILFPSLFDIKLFGFDVYRWSTLCSCTHRAGCLDWKKIEAWKVLKKRCKKHDSNLLAIQQYIFTVHSKCHWPSSLHFLFVCAYPINSLQMAVLNKIKNCLNCELFVVRFTNWMHLQWRAGVFFWWCALSALLQVWSETAKIVVEGFEMLPTCVLLLYKVHTAWRFVRQLLSLFFDLGAMAAALGAWVAGRLDGRQERCGTGLPVQRTSQRWR